MDWAIPKTVVSFVDSYRINEQELRNRKKMYRGWYDVRLSDAKHATCVDQAVQFSLSMLTRGELCVQKQ